MDLIRTRNKDVIHHGPPASGKTTALVNEAVKYVIEGSNNPEHRRAYIVSSAHRMSKWILDRVQDKLVSLGVQATIEDGILSVKGNRTKVEAETFLVEASPVRDSLVLMDEYASIDHKVLLEVLETIKYKRYRGETVRVEMTTSPTNWLSDYIIRKELNALTSKQLI